MENNGVKDTELLVTEEAVRDIIRYYTREAGVRGLDREIAKICRKIVRELSRKGVKKPVKVGSNNLNGYLGVRKFDFGLAEKESRVGMVTGLAWTQVGVEVLAALVKRLVGGF